MALDLAGLKPVGDAPRFDVGGLKPLDVAPDRSFADVRQGSIDDNEADRFRAVKTMAAAASPNESDWLDLGKKALENGWTSFRQAAGGIAQYAGENMPAPYGADVPMGFAESAQAENLSKAMKGSVAISGSPANIGKAIYDAATADIKANAPKLNEGSAKDYAYQAGTSLVQMIPTLAASLATGSPAPGLALMGGQVAGQQYGQARNESGRSPDQAGVDAMFYALAETIPEQIPLGILMKPGGKFLPRLLKTMGAEGLQEAFTQVLESGYDKGTVSPDMTWGDAFRQVRDAGIVGAVMGGGLGAAAHPFTRGGAEEPKPEPEAPPAAEPGPQVEPLSTQGLTPLEAPPEAAPVPTAAKVIPNEEPLYDATGESQIGWHDRATGRIRMLEKQPEEVARAVMDAPSLHDAIATAEAEAFAPVHGLPEDVAPPVESDLVVPPAPLERVEPVPLAPVSSLETPAVASAGEMPPAARAPEGITPAASEINALAEEQPQEEITPPPARTGRVRGLPRRLTKGPEDAAMFLASQGGIRNDEGHDLVKGRGLQQFVPGLGPLIRPKGMTIDAAGQKLWEAGFFGQVDHGEGVREANGPTEADVLELLERTGRGGDGRPTKVFRPGDAADIEIAREGERVAEANASVLEDVHNYAKSLSETLTEAEADQIVSDMVAHGIDAESAVVEHLERKAIQEDNEDHADAAIQPAPQAHPVVERAPGVDRAAGSGVQEPEAVPGNEGGPQIESEPAQADSGTSDQPEAEVASQPEGIPPLPHGNGSWVIVDRATGHAAAEIFKGDKAISRVNLERYKAVPAGEYLASLNKAKALTIPSELKPLATEPGALDGQGRAVPQTIAPGADRSAIQLSAAREAAGHGLSTTKVQQKDAGGMFAAPEEKATDLFEASPKVEQADNERPMAQRRETVFDWGNEGGGSRVTKIGPTEITYGIGKDKTAELTLVRTAKGSRKQGAARAAVEQFLREADARGYAVHLTADPMEPTVSRSRLKNFYKTLGFVENRGRTRDFSTRAGMIREPQSAPLPQRPTPRITDTFTPEFKAKRREVEKELRARLEKLGLHDIGLRISDATAIDGEPVNGHYYRKVIAVALDAPNPIGTFNHEAVHATRALGLFTKSEWSMLANRAAKDWHSRFDIGNRYSEFSEDQQNEEAIAEAFQAWTKDQGTQKGTIARIFHKVRDALSAIGNALKGQGFDTTDRIFQRLDTGEVGSRERPSTKPPEASGPVAERRRETGPFSRLGVEPNEGISDYLTDSSLSLAEKLKGAASPQVLSESVDRWRRLFQDRFIPLLRTQQAIEKQTGKKLALESNPYLAEELSSGRKGAKLEDLSEKMVRPLMANMASRNITLPELETYLYARHAPERNSHIAQINQEFAGDMLKEEGAGSGMTNADAAQIMQAVKASGKEKDLKALAGMVDKILDFGLRERVSGGLMSQDQADTWRATFQNYVPLRGKAEVDGSEIDRPRFGRGINIRGAESQRAFGRNSKAKDILAYSIMQAEEAIVRAETNKVGQSFYELAKENPNPDFWKVDKITERPVWNEAKGQVEYRPVDRLLAEDKDYTVSLKIDGTEHRVTLNRDNPNAVELAKSMRNLDSDKMGALLRAFSHVNRLLSHVNTTLNPEFVITNAFRDAQTALTNLAGEEQKGIISGTLKDYLPAVRAATRGAFGKTDGDWGKWYNEFRENGGRVYFNSTDNVAEIRDRIEHDLSRLAAGKSPQSTLTAIKNFIGKTNLGVENGIRLAAFKNARERGMSPEEAASLAKNLTVNFNRRGELGPLMNSLYLFYNASVQGTARLLLAMKSPRVRKVLYSAAIMGATLDILNSLTSGDDDDGEKYYDKISDFEKRHNLIIMDPTSDKGRYFKLPLPYGYNVFFGMGRNASEIFRGKPVTRAFTDLAVTAVDAFNPIGGTESLLNLIAPTVLDPIVDLSRNKDYTGRPIMPDQPQYGPKEAEHNRYWGTVSPLAKHITDFLNQASGGDDVVPGKIDVSPEVLDYLFGQVTGAAGTFYSRLANLVPRLADPTSTVSYNDIPLARKVSGGKPIWYDKQMFYERADSIEEAYQRAKDYGLKGDGEGRREFIQENRAAITMRPYAERARSALADVRKKRNALAMLSERGGIGKDAYNTRVNALQDKEQAIISQFNKVYLGKGLPSEP
jgi:hypothetical protein